MPPLRLPRLKASLQRAALAVACMLFLTGALDARRASYAPNKLDDKQFFAHDPFRSGHRIIKRRRPVGAEKGGGGYLSRAPAVIEPLDEPEPIQPAPDIAEQVISAARVDDGSCIGSGVLSNRIAPTVADNGGHLVPMKDGDEQRFLSIAAPNKGNEAADSVLIAAFADQDSAVVFMVRGNCVQKPPLRIGYDLFVKAQQAVVRSHL